MGDVDNRVVAIQGNSVKNESLSSLQDGYALTWDNTNSQWRAEPVITSGGPASGDLYGLYPSPLIDQEYYF